jgi:biopolymer transport protein ExbB
MRSLYVKALETRAMLEKKAVSEKENALKEARQERESILQNRELLHQRLTELKLQNKKLTTEVESLSAEAAHLAKNEEAVSGELAEAEKVVHELVGIVRINSKDIKTLIEQNLQTGLFHPDTAFLQNLLEEGQFPGMNDVRRMVKLLKEQIHQSEGVIIKEGQMVGRDGREIKADILLVGPFTAAYRHGDETGLLSYSAPGRKFYALSKLPPSGISKVLVKYMAGSSDDAPVDISRGGAVRELTSSPNLWEQIKNGGSVVWPILGVFATGLFIIIERCLFLFRRRVNSETLLKNIEYSIFEDRWDKAIGICRNLKSRPLARVLLAGMNAMNMGREEIENALQEAILTEIPSMERFLSSLGMLAAIAPLLGLLGTVTGMINTFHVITLHGTGDPRLMSAGISEALVTTMLGLTAAIPLMLANNLLGNEVEKRIAEMEEKSVALVNIIFKSRKNGEEN